MSLVFTFTNFSGHYPVGTAAVVVAGVDATISDGIYITATTGAVVVAPVNASISSTVIIEATTGTVVITSVDVVISSVDLVVDTSENIINLAGKIKFEFNLLETTRTQFYIAAPLQFSFESDQFDFEHSISSTELGALVIA